jgi:hypothetical protein
MSQGVEIQLPMHVIFYAGIKGFELTYRKIGKAVAMGSVHGIDNESVGWSPSIDGAIAETAVARALGIWWDGGTRDKYDEPDIGNWIQVRSSRHDDGCLTVYAYNPKPHAYVFVSLARLMSEKTVRIAGWLYGHEAMKAEWWEEKRKGGAAYWAPQSALRPFDELIKIYTQTQYGTGQNRA